MLEGSCFCGACRFSLARQPRVVAHCHCTICQRVHGAAFGTFAQLPAKYFAWHSDSERPSRIDTSDTLARFFCGRCGSPLMHQPSGDEPAWVAVSAPCLQTSLETLPLAHTFVADRPVWSALPEDGLPRFAAHAPNPNDKP